MEKLVNIKVVSNLSHYEITSLSVISNKFWEPLTEDANLSDLLRR